VSCPLPMGHVWTMAENPRPLRPGSFRFACYTPRFRYSPEPDPSEVYAKLSSPRSIRAPGRGGPVCGQRA